MSTPRAWIMVSNTILQKKEAGLLVEMADSRTREQNVPDDPGAS